MKILAMEHEIPGDVGSSFQRHAKAEARKAWELHQSGAIRELYFRTDQYTAVLVLECASVEDAASILDELPFVKEGLITFELIPLKAYSGFERLFNENE